MAFGQGSQISMPLVNLSGLPLNGLEVAQNVNEVLTNTNIIRYVGLSVFCIDEAQRYIFKTGITDADFVPESSGNGFIIVDDYSKLPNTTIQEIAYCKNDYTDISIIPNITYDKGFYLYVVADNKWEIISGNVKKRYPEYIFNGHDYFVGDTFSYNGLYYQVITDFTSTSVFANDEPNFIHCYEKYFALTQVQHDKLVADGVITSTTNDLYIITDAQVTPTGSGTLANDLTTNISVGGIPKGKTYPSGTNIEDILRELLIKYFPPDVVLELIPSTLLYKKGSIINPLNIEANVTKNSENIVSVEYYIDTTQVDSKDITTDPSLPSGGTYSYLYTNDITKDTNISVIVNDGKQLVTETKQIEFVVPFYYGTNSTDTITSITNLKEALEKKSDKSYVFSSTGQYLVFMYDKSYGDLTKILDQNGFNNTQSFNKKYIAIGGIDYTCYTSIDPVFTQNFTYEFIF